MANSKTHLNFHKGTNQPAEQVNDPTGIKPSWNETVACTLNNAQTAMIDGVPHCFSYLGSKPYDVAHQMCSRFDANLPLPRSIKGSSDLRAVFNSLKATKGNPIIDLTDLRTEGTFVNSDENEPNWSNWYPGHPDTAKAGNDYVAMFDDNRWIVVGKGQFGPVICQQRLVPTEPPTTDPPTTTTTTTTTTLFNFNTTCFDKVSSCNQWHRLGYCEKRNQWMDENCRRTCNTCFDIRVNLNATCWDECGGEGPCDKCGFMGRCCNGDFSKEL